MVVTLEFDDDTADQAELGQMLAERGMHATFFVNSGTIGRPGFLSQAQLLAFQAQGNEIAGHTIDHAELPPMRPDVMGAEICGDRKRLLAMGFRVVDFAYPFGLFTPTVQQVVRQCGYVSARRVGGVACTGCLRSEPLPPPHPFATRTAPVVGLGSTVRLMARPITKAERLRRPGWLQFIFHEVCDGCAEASIPAPTLAAFLDWLRRHRIAVRTVREAIGARFIPPEL